MSKVISIKNSDIILNLDTMILLLNIDKNLVNFKTKNFTKFNLNKKEELHITIFGSEIGKKIIEKLDFLTKEEKNIIINDIQILIKSIDWDFRLKEEYFYIKKDYINNENRESIIQIVKLNGLEEFNNKLNFLLKTSFDLSFAHITLFTNSNIRENKLRGIGFYSKEELNKLKPIKI